MILLNWSYNNDDILIIKLLIFWYFDIDILKIIKNVCYLKKKLYIYIYIYDGFSKYEQI